MSDIKVIKSGGNTEYFSYDKLLASIGKSGVPLPEATKIASSIENWVKSTAVKGNVTSTQIGGKVVEFMAKDFPTEADSYKIYKKGI